MSGCDFLESSNSEQQTNRAPTREILPTREAVPPTETFTPEPTQTQTPSASENTPTPVFTPTPETVLFESPAGYQLIHPSDWMAQDYLGQTILAHNTADLTQPQGLSNYPVILVSSGSAEGRTAEELMVEIPIAILNRDQLIVGESQPIVRGNGEGHQFRQIVVVNEVSLELLVEAVVREQLFTVALAIMPDNTAEDDRALMETILATMSLTKNRFDLNPVEYGLSAKRIDELNRSLASAQDITGLGQPLIWGESVGRVEAGEAAVYELVVENSLSLSLEIMPNNPDFDVTVDVIDSAGTSLLLDGQMSDRTRAGEAERISALQLSTGNYFIVVRGFALTGGTFILNASR